MDGNRNEKPQAVGEKKKEIGGHFSVDAKKEKWEMKSSEATCGYVLLITSNSTN